MRSAFIAEHRDRFGVRANSRCLAVQPSGFYVWQKSPLGQRAREDARQTDLIPHAWKDSGKGYGYRKLHDDLLDQGEPCCPIRVVRLTRLAGITAQTGYRRRPGSCHDNAVAESCFSSPKRERIRRPTYKTREEALQDVFDYIEMFYYPIRKHIRNGKLSPVELERQRILKAEGV